MGELLTNAANGKNENVVIDTKQRKKKAVSIPICQSTLKMTF